MKDHYTQNFFHKGLVPWKLITQEKEKECHIFQELDQLRINKSELPQQKLMELDLKKPFRFVMKEEIIASSNDLSRSIGSYRIHVLGVS